MKKVAILEIYPNKKLDKNKVIDAHLRNSILLEDILDADLLCIENEYAQALKKSYDVLILPYASFYAPFKLIAKLCENNPDARKIIISNEYNMCQTIGSFKPPYEVIANYEKCQIKKEHVNAFHFLNLNLLLTRPPNVLSNKKYDCLYYSTFRPNRKEYMKKYLREDIWLSTSSKNFKKFLNEGCTSKLTKKLDWQKRKETLNLFRYSLYLEDDFTHTTFNNLANRWYEAGFCNCVVFFDANCKNTILKSEIGDYWSEIEFYLVNSYKELQNKIKICNENFAHHLETQKSWRKNEMNLREEMIDNLYEIIHLEKRKKHGRQ